MRIQRVSGERENMLQMAVFNVGRGCCIAIVTPNGYLILVDCGNTEGFSPVQFLRRCQTDAILGEGRLAFTPWHGADLAYLVITHPHSDHISDIETLYSELRPSLIVHRPELDWNKVQNSNQNNTPFNFYRSHFFWPPGYIVPAISEPVLGYGMSYYYYCLSIDQVAAISSSDTDYVNNSSYVSVLKYAGRTIAITGDMTTQGMESLLGTSPELRTAIAGTTIMPGVDILIAPHHGHQNGFSPVWFNLAGPTKFFNIVSERSQRPNESPGQTNVDSRYSDIGFSLGLNHDGRRMFSTRQDGNILVRIESNGNCTYETFGSS